MKVNAAVFVTPGQPLEMRELESGELLTGETLVRIEACTLCGSDLHTYHGRRAAPAPSILGHEILGTVEYTNGDVRTYDGRLLQPGDRITWCVAASCGQCFFCRNALPQKCVHLRKYGHQSLDSDMPLSGGMAEYCRLSAGTAVVHVPQDLSAALVCPASCATATVAAVLRRAGFARGETVVVQGLGMLGLSACAMAHEAGARWVIGVDPDERRAASARHFGADAVLLPGDPTLATMVRDLTEGRGADVVLELSGDRSAIVSGLSLLRVGGRYVLAGALIPGPAVPIDPRDLITRMLSIHGVHNYEPCDLASSIEFLKAAGSRYPFPTLVNQEFALARANDAFLIPPDSRPPRVMIRP